MYFYITTILTLSSMTPLRTDIHSKVEIEVVPTANSHTCRTFYPLYSYFPLKVVKETRNHRYTKLPYIRIWRLRSIRSTAVFKTLDSAPHNHHTIRPVDSM